LTRWTTAAAARLARLLVELADDDARIVAAPAVRRVAGGVDAALTTESVRRKALAHASAGVAETADAREAHVAAAAAVEGIRGRVLAGTLTAHEARVGRTAWALAGPVDALPAGQGLVHEPQWEGSDWKSVQSSPPSGSEHSIKLQLHAPPSQISPEGHAFPQAPQLWLSASRFVHASPLGTGHVW
jgi:hypothetical protein